MNLNHWLQMVNSNKFQFYDYGEMSKKKMSIEIIISCQILATTNYFFLLLKIKKLIENMQEYGQKTPPEINLANITEDIHLFAGDTDELADPVNVIMLFNQLINSKGKSINMYHMGHATFLMGKNMMYMQDVLKILA